METNDNSKLFDAYYFAHGCGRPYQRDEEWLSFFDSIAEQIVKRINPKTVLDAGCAMGFLVEALRNRGVEAYGTDISEYAINNVHEDIKEYCWSASVTEPFPQNYDMIVVIEVLEHLKQTEAEKAVENICRFSDDVLFSSTPFDYKEASHFNVQPPEYWAELFAVQDLYRDLDFNASFITPWTVRFRRKYETPVRLVREYERMYFQLFKENSDLRSLILENRDKLINLENQLNAKDNQLRLSLTRASELEEELDTYKEEVNKLEHQISINEMQINDLKEQTQRLEFKSQDYKNQLIDVLNSRSWRLMKKFQAVRLFFIPKDSKREELLLYIVRFPR
jgi:SAM-dependent methyltransferase